MTERIYRPFDELKEVHPATERWLKQHGYHSDHHVPMPTYGIADFVGVDRHGHSLVIECKADCINMGRSIVQVLDYASQINGTVSSAIAVPILTVTAEAGRLCKRRNVRLIALSIEPHYIEAPEPRAIPSNTIANMRAFSIALSCFNKPIEYIGQILEWHRTSFTALGDLLWARDMAIDFYTYITNVRMKPYYGRLGVGDIERVLHLYDQAIETVAPFLAKPYANLDRNLMPAKFADLIC